MEKYNTYREYQESYCYWIEKIPSHWQMKKVKHLFSFNKDRNKEKDPVVLSLTMKGIRVRNIHNNEGQLAASYDNYISVKKNDIVFNPMDLISGWVDMVPLKGVISPAYQTIRPLRDEIELNYAKYYFQRLYKEKVLFYYGKGISFDYRWTLGDEALMNFPITLPPKEEQIAIAKFLDRKTQEIREFIALKEQTIALLKERKTAIINKAVTKGLDPTVEMKDSGVEWLGEIPKHWEVKKLKYLTRIFRGKFTHRPRNDESLYDGKYPFIQTGDVSKAGKYITSYKQTVNEKGFKVTKEFPKGTLVMTIAASVGEVSILDFTACFPDSLVGFYPVDNNIVDFLYYQFSALRNELFKESTENTQLNLNIDRVGNIFCAKPPVEEQKLIIKNIENIAFEIDKSISQAEQEIALIKEYQKSLISDAVTGKIDVREEVEV